LIVIAILIVAFVFVAAPLHLASTGFGWKKIAMLVFGVLVLVVGLALSLIKGESK